MKSNILGTHVPLKYLRLYYAGTKAQWYSLVNPLFTVSLRACTNAEKLYVIEAVSLNRILQHVEKNVNMSTHVPVDKDNKAL